MRMLVKLAALLVLFAICFPTHAEILIYNNTIRGFASEGEGITVPKDPNTLEWNWNGGEQLDRGFLILDVDIDPNTAAIAGINKATQVEYWRNDQSKYYEQIQYYFGIDKIELGNKIYWVLTDIFTPQDGQVLILMIKGEATMCNIGLGRKEQRREIPLTLQGSAIGFVNNQNDEVESTYREIQTVSLRLHNRWTRLANLYWEAYDPLVDYYNPFEWAEGGIDKKGEPYGIVKEWLIQRGYTDIVSGTKADEKEL
jgi:hypothetical protein